MEISGLTFGIFRHLASSGCLTFAAQLGAVTSFALRVRDIWRGIFLGVLIRIFFPARTTCLLTLKHLVSSESWAVLEDDGFIEAVFFVPHLVNCRILTDPFLWNVLIYLDTSDRFSDDASSCWCTPTQQISVVCVHKWIWDIFHGFYCENCWWNVRGSIPLVIDVHRGRQAKQFEGGEY